ncbi:MAG: sigma-54-dependent transcriptional regulator, partial [Candidatus Poribacteria bacterium]
MPERILVADDQTAMQDLLTDLLERRGAEAVAVGTAEEGLEQISKSPDGFDLAILDLDFGEGAMNGITCLEEIKKINPSLPVIILTGKGTISTAVEAIKLGAQEYVEKDFYLEENMELALTRLDRLIRATIDNKRLRREREFYREELKGRYNIIGKSRAIRQMLELIEEVAPMPRPVTIRGERGTGKELVAAAIHNNSDRRKNAFITVNCAALAEGLLECELFGQEDNAFTNSSFREGRFVLADKGTLFLDEIGNMSPEFQQKILRVLEYQQFERVGGTKTVKVDVRVIAATNSDLELDIESGKFRADLYDRLAFETIWLPPLRNRKEDIEILCYHFMDGLAAEV